MNDPDSAPRWLRANQPLEPEVRASLDASLKAGSTQNKLVRYQ